MVHGRKIALGVAFSLTLALIAGSAADAADRRVTTATAIGSRQAAESRSDKSPPKKHPEFGYLGPITSGPGFTNVVDVAAVKKKKVNVDYVHWADYAFSSQEDADSIWKTAHDFISDPSTSPLSKLKAKTGLDARVNPDLPGSVQAWHGARAVTYFLEPNWEESNAPANANTILMIGQYFLERRFARGIGASRPRPKGPVVEEVIPPTGDISTISVVAEQEEGAR